MDRKLLCDEDCNHCKVVGSYNYGMVTFVLNKLYDKFGDEVYDIVESACPNLTVCRDCRVDDFCHVEGCELVEQEAAVCI